MCTWISYYNVKLCLQFAKLKILFIVLVCYWIFYCTKSDLIYLLALSSSLPLGSLKFPFEFCLALRLKSIIYSWEDSLTGVFLACCAHFPRSGPTEPVDWRGADRAVAELWATKRPHVLGKRHHPHQLWALASHDRSTGNLVNNASQL